MAHGASSEEIQHPDLTAMLDVVMQMLMYFIMCARLINEQVTADVLLPVSQAAKPMSAGEGDVLFLNINAEGKLLALGEAPMILAEARLWLDKRASEYKDKEGKVQAAVVIRAHRDCGYADVYKIMQACKDKGFRRFKLRAMMSGG
jgi:biopolymer transport protein ExbD